LTVFVRLELDFTRRQRHVIMMGDAVINGRLTLYQQSKKLSVDFSVHTNNPGPPPCRGTVEERLKNTAACGRGGFSL